MFGTLFGTFGTFRTFGTFLDPGNNVPGQHMPAVATTLSQSVPGVNPQSARLVGNLHTYYSATLGRWRQMSHAPLPLYRYHVHLTKATFSKRMLGSGIGSMIPQTVLALRGSDGFSKDPWTGGVLAELGCEKLL